MMPLAALDLQFSMFVLFALVACGFAIAVAATSNVVRMAFYLTLCLGATSGLFFLAGAEFLGAMQLMIYVGGTLVLLIFGVMLTAQSRFISMQTSAGEWILSLIVGSSLLLLLVRSAVSVDDWNTPLSDQDNAALIVADSKTSTPIGLALSGVRVDKPDQLDPVLRGGMSGYLLPFVIVSMHLLVVLIGAGYMARTKKAGSLLDRPAPAAPPADRKHSWPVKGLLIIGMLMNLGAAGFAFAIVPIRSAVAAGKLGEAATKAWQTIPALTQSPQWAWIMLGLLGLANILLLVVVWRWQKWGAVGLVLVPLLQAAVMANAGFSQMDVVGNTVMGLLPVALLVGLLVVGTKPSEWSQME